MFWCKKYLRNHMQQREDTLWDVVVVGGGPAGMMAAGVAAARGKKVLLLEKNKTLGKKLLITGGGRCNVTNNKPDIREMLAKYKKSDKFLFSAFSQFGVAEAIQFFHGRGMQTKEENEGRMFPLSNSAQSVWDVLVREMQKHGVHVRTGAAVKDIKQTSRGFSVVLQNGTEIAASACVVAVGGTSRPETGSTGDGYAWARALGHKVIENDFALVPVALRDAWAKKLGGVALPDSKLTLLQDGKKQAVQKGKLLFTHFGISGPAVLNLSRTIGEFLGYGDVTLLLDLFPTTDPGGLKTQMQTLLVTESNKKIKNTLGSLVPKALVPALLELAHIDGETPCHSVRSKERTVLVSLLKKIPLQVQGLLGADKAVVSSGGVVPEEVDFKTMQSRLVPNLFIVGDLLNIDRPSGGYSLQLCWTTGFVAGTHV
jgi:hypothetical protein